MSIVALREIPDDPELRREWDALVSETHSPQVFYTYEWARAVQLAYGESLCPLLLLERDQDRRLTGVAALAAPKGAPVSFLCATTGDYCDFVVREQDATGFTSRVFENLRQMGYRDVVLTNFPEDSPCYANLANAAQGFHRYTRTAYVCTQLSFRKIPENGGKLELPRQKMVRRSLRAMGGGTALETISETTWEKVSALLPEFFRAHVARFAFTGRVSNLTRPERREFLIELAKLLGPSGWLRVTRLNAGARTVAWNYGFKFCGTTFWYQPTFVNYLEKYSPGFVLLSKLIEESAQDSSIATVDLGLGAEGYKDAFANSSRRTMYMTLHQSPVRHWKEILRHRAAKIVWASPRVERAARNLRAKSRSLLARIRESGLAATLKWLMSRMLRSIFLKEEVFFFEATTTMRSQPPVGTLRAMNYDLIAEAAMQFYDDEEALRYLLRAAARLREGKAEGFALVNATGAFVHFAWVADFEGFFLSELNAEVEAPTAESVMLFDCWTSSSERGRGYYGLTIGLISRVAQDRGKRPWIFSAASNRASLNGIEKAGFERRYSLIRQRILGWQRIKGETPRLDDDAMGKSQDAAKKIYPKPSSSVAGPSDASLSKPISAEQVSPGQSHQIGSR
jgi:CelD/BcsL family acetyltransferase involved in cellulose biosynthesis